MNTMNISIPLLLHRPPRSILERKAALSTPNKTSTDGTTPSGQLLAPLLRLNPLQDPISLTGEPKMKLISWTIIQLRMETCRFRAQRCIQKLSRIQSFAVRFPCLDPTLCTK